ncbi:MAG TPA: MFS transporter [Chitinophagaceae bacterium]|nr:MFS transporter [Chitinophagaceae bacterium]
MRIITRTVLILSFVSLFADVASEMLYPIIPVYLKEIGFSVLWIGILEGFVNFAAGISKGYFGKLSDEKGSRLPFVKLGYFLSAISKPLIGFFTAALWIFFVRTLDRLGKGVRVAAKDALISQEATKETKARVFGFNRSLDTAGATIGPAIALVFLLYYPGEYKTLFYIAFIPGIISVLFLFLLKEKKQPVSTLEKGNFFSFFKYWKIATPEYKKLVTGLLLFALFNSSDVFLLLKTKEVIGDDTIRILGTTFTGDTITIAAYVLYNLVWALGSYPLGALADKIGFKKLFLIGLLIFATVYAGFAFDPSITIIFLLFALYGIFSAATDGISKAWITNIAHNKNTATAVGFYTSCQSICTLGASTIAGFIWSNLGSSYTFIMTAAIAFFVMTYFFLSFRKN